MGIVFFWLILSVLIGLLGKNRNIGFWGAFVLSLLLSPLIGLIITLFSKTFDQSSVIPRDVQEFMKRASSQAKKGNYIEAISELEKALILKPDYSIIDYNIACYYSKLNDTEKCLEFISKAVSKGYKNFELINKDKDLAFVRSQPEYKEFALNGYKH